MFIRLFCFKHIEFLKTMTGEMNNKLHLLPMPHPFSLAFVHVAKDEYLNSTYEILW